MLNALHITRLHDEATLRWHQAPPAAAPLVDPAAPLPDLVLAHHRANFDLWHEEDKAREPGASDARIASVKRAIDALNQTRNDLVEALDRTLLDAAGEQNSIAPLHSESPGLILDRLSVLALKLYHTAEESRRTSASEAHRAAQPRSPRSARRAARRPRRLPRCPLGDVLHGRRRFKLYRQLKMYNDPDLNPEVYSHKPGPPNPNGPDTG
jgi:hypothetical protein